MNKLLPLLVVSIFVLSGLQAVASPLALIDEKHHLLTNRLGNHSPLGDELDQQQTECDSYFWVGYATIQDYLQVAQSFVPSKEVVTRVELYIAKDVTTDFPYEVAIRESLTGENLTKTSVPPQDIPNELEWVEFDFDDIQVIPGHLYYIVSSTKDSEENRYAWGGAFLDPYFPGSAFWSDDGGQTWDEGGGYDMCFKTYGKDKLDLDPVLKGGVGVKLVVENIGSAIAEDMDYTITVTGGFLQLINISTDGIIAEIEAGEIVTIKADSFIGLGRIEVTATAELYELRATGFVFLFFVIIMQN